MMLFAMFVLGMVMTIALQQAWYPHRNRMKRMWLRLRQWKADRRIKAYQNRWKLNVWQRLMYRVDLWAVTRVGTRLQPIADWVSAVFKEEGIDLRQAQYKRMKLTVVEVDQVLAKAVPYFSIQDRMMIKNVLIERGLMETGEIRIESAQDLLAHHTGAYNFG